MSAVLELEYLVLGIIRGLGMIGDAFAGFINWLLNDFLGFGLPAWVGKIVMICVTAFTLWRLSKNLPLIIVGVAAVAALFIVFGSYF